MAIKLNQWQEILTPTLIITSTSPAAAECSTPNCREPRLKVRTVCKYCYLARQREIMRLKKVSRQLNTLTNE